MPPKINDGLTSSQRYKNSEHGKKKRTIYNWKVRGVKSNEYESLEELYDRRYIVTTHCELCNIELIGGSKGSNRKILDHDHETGEFRNIMCHKCNHRPDKKSLFYKNKNYDSGISFDIKSNQYRFRKQIDGKQYSKNFDNKIFALWYKYLFILKIKAGISLD